MNKPKSPCLGCAERSVTPEHNCHSDCGRYIACRDANIARKQLIKQQRQIESMVTETVINNVSRMKKHHPTNINNQYRNGKG